MSKPQYVDITNGELTGRCMVQALPAWEANGWTPVDDESSEVTEQSGSSAMFEALFASGDDQPVTDENEE